MNQEIPSSRNYSGNPFPESLIELQDTLLKSSAKDIFEDPQLGKLFSDDSVRSVLSEEEIQAIMLFAAAYVNFRNASHPPYDFSEAQEYVLVQIYSLLNYARSRQGINLTTVLGRGMLPRRTGRGFDFDSINPIPKKNNSDSNSRDNNVNYSNAYSSDDFYNYPRV